MIEHRHDISDESINAFLDDQLDSEDRLRIFWRSEEDPGVQQRVYELRKIKEMVSEAYKNPPMPSREEVTERPNKQFFPREAIAASLFLVLGVTAGWVAHEQYGAVQPGSSVFPAKIANLGSISDEFEKIILHINSNDSGKVSAALDQIERLASNASPENGRLKIEVIVNSDGLDIVRDGSSHYNQRVRHLIDSYDNVSIMACEKAIELLRNSTGIQAKLLEGVLTAPSALEQIIMRMRDGWVYIRV